MGKSLRSFLMLEVIALLLLTMPLLTFAAEGGEKVGHECKGQKSFICSYAGGGGP